MATIYNRVSDNVAPNATLSLTSGTVNGSYPLANLVDGNPAKPAKTTGTTAIIRAAFAAPQAIDIVAFGPHNLAGATVSIQNESGLNQAIAIPANTEDGLSVNPFVDLTGITLATRTGQNWDLHISGAANPIAIGEYMLIATKRTMPILWGVVESEDFPSLTIETDFKSLMKYWLGVKQRTVHVTINDDTFRSDYYSLIRSAQGQYKAILFVPDSSVNDALFVDLSQDSHDLTRSQPNVSDIQLTFRELQRGLAL
jgi:hypothetical protein